MNLSGQISPILLKVYFDFKEISSGKNKVLKKPNFITSTVNKIVSVRECRNNLCLSTTVDNHTVLWWMLYLL